MAPKDYTEVSEGVYQSDIFSTSRPKIDSDRIQQILNEQRPASQIHDDSAPICVWNPTTPAQEQEKV